MASVSLNHAALRSGTQADIANHLCHLRATAAADPAVITAQLHDAVTQGSVPQAVFHVWTPLHRDAESTLAGLRQSESLVEKRAAIKAFVRALRSPESTSRIWSAAGGTRGVATIMSNLSVNEIRLLCDGLVRTASLVRGRPERQATLTELVDLLCSNTPGDNPDARPLLDRYRRILPACQTDRVIEHEETRPSWSPRQRTILIRAHPAFYEAKFLESLFSSDPKNTTVDACDWAQLTCNNFGFAKQVLSRLVQADDGKLPVDSAEITTKLVLPIAKRLRRKRTGTERNLPLEVLELIVQLFKKHNCLVKELNAQPNGVIHHVVKFWEFARSARHWVGQHLVELIGLVPESVFQSAENVVALVRAVNSAVGYRLFRLIIRSSTYHRLDIDVDNDVSDAFQKLKGPWPSDLFTMLAAGDPDAALRFFKNLRATFPDTHFLDTSTTKYGKTSILEYGKDPESAKGDPDILEALLMRASSTGFVQGSDLADRIEKRLQHCKNKSATSRDSSDRHGWARCALNLVVAAGSLDLYSDTLVWARRFNKDVDTIRQLYSGRQFESTECIDLLSGIPSNLGHFDSPAADIAGKVRSANKILMLLLETAAMAVREPNFWRFHWEDVLTLPARVVERRFQGADKLQDAGRFSDDEVYDILWKPTLEVMIEAESYLLQPASHPLYPPEFGGLLRDIKFPQRFTWRPHSAAFLDNLAKGRDQLWRQYRPKHHPAVLALGKAWPRGLAVQDLCPSSIDDVASLLFVRSRIEAVVFGSPNLLHEQPPDDREAREAIGRFVEDYGCALKAYVGRVGTATREAHEDRVRNAWRYAVDVLTGGRMTEPESRCFWADKFRMCDIKLPRDLRAEIPTRPQPEIPEVDDPERPTEWNPDSGNMTADDASREIPATILDQMLQPSRSWVTAFQAKYAASWSEKVTVKVNEDASFWDSERLEKPISWKTKDGFVAALLLHLNTLHGADTSILKKPFPSAADARYPALYLDEDFLDAFKDSSEGFQWASNSTGGRGINRLINSGPAPLLALVAKSVLQAVDEEDDSSFNGDTSLDVAMRLVGLLTTSDRPSLAFPLIRDVILNRPDDSAWHRQLFGKRLFNSLSPKESKELLDSIVDEIQARLDDQPLSGDKSTTNGPEGSPKPALKVKVTTVKMVAQLLGGSSFLDARTTLDILSRLLTKARHIDIRIAIFESLFSILEEVNTASSVGDEIITLLRKHAAPIAASFSERGPSDPETAGGLPLVDATSSDTAIRQMFIQWASKFKDNREMGVKLARLTSEVVEMSAKNNRQWLQLFLEKHDFALTEELPLVPVDSAMLSPFVETPEYLTRPVFEMIRTAVLTSISPPPGIAAISKQIRRSKVLSSENDGRYWRHMFDNRGASYLIYRTGALRLLKRMHQPVSSEHVTTAMLQQFASDILHALIHNDTPEMVGKLFSDMSSEVVNEKDPESLERWKTITLPLLRQVISHVEELRTPAWQRSPDRQPKVLPDTLNLKISMLAVPPGVGLEKMFVEEVSVLIDEIARDPVFCDQSWENLKREAVHLHRDWRPHLVCLGVLMGSPDRVNTENPTVADVLRVKFAKHLLVKGFEFMDHPRSKTVVDDLKNMLLRWAESPIELFRISATEIVSNIKARFDNEWFTHGGVPWERLGVYGVEDETD